MAPAVVLTRWQTDRSLHETAVRPAFGAAQNSVRCYVGYEERPTSAMTRREIARVGIALILAFGDPLDVHEGIEGPARSLGAFVVGNQSHASLTEISGGHQHGVQVELSAAGAVALFGQVQELNDMAIPVDEVLSTRGAQLVEHLGNAATWEHRFALLDHFFAREIVDGDSSGGAIAAEVSWLRSQLLATSGQARVEPLMDETGWSRRVVTERFRSQLGVSPKAFARIVRFKRAVALLEGVRRGRTLADVAMECGYYDQSHFTRDCVALAGCSPSVLMAESTGEPGVRFIQDDEVVGCVQ